MTPPVEQMVSLRKARDVQTFLKACAARMSAET